MEEIIAELKAQKFQGEIKNDDQTLDFYSHDASLFEIKPQLVVAPKDSSDVQKLVQIVAKNKKSHPDLSLTARSAGTDMSGGAINDSIIVDFNQHFTQIGNITANEGQAQPGVFFRDFDTETAKQNVLMPTYPASRDLCTIGGMVNNNAGGEKSLEFGKTENFVTELRVVFADGVERTVRPLHKNELDSVMAQNDFESQVYREIFDLVDKNYDTIKAAKPHVSKNSTGYNLWDVWDRDKGIFDLTKLIVGSQGTLGLTTGVKLKLIPRRAHSGLLVLFLRGMDDLGELIPKVLQAKPATFESFDDQTLWLSIRFMPSFLRMLGPVKFIKLLFSLIPDGLLLLKGIPKLILMVEFNGDTEEEVRQKVRNLHRDLAQHRARYEINGFEETPTEGKSEKFWLMRRQSFNILRKKVKDKHTAPFIDDLVVNPPHLVEFLPKLQQIIRKYKLFATVAGHMGDGNFHIIPLMKLEDPRDRAKLEPAMREVNELILKYKGSLSGEHNDGLVRGPWLKQMYGPEVLAHFQKAKDIMDPGHIFNPHKKANADWDYSFSHVRKSF